MHLNKFSISQVELQPSPDTVFPSSHFLAPNSVVNLFPSPHFGVQTDFYPSIEVHYQPGFTTQIPEHPSAGVKFPSSQNYPIAVFKTPSPQSLTQTEGSPEH